MSPFHALFVAGATRKSLKVTYETGTALASDNFCAKDSAVVFYGVTPAGAVAFAAKKSATGDAVFTSIPVSFDN
eukprot:7837386-Karenia_brevis.AAC.1